MSKELTLQEAALAWAQGKRVEAKRIFPEGAPWSQIAPLGSVQNRMWPASIFNDPTNTQAFRLAPEPPAKRFRPWTPEEVPVGAQVRYKGNSNSIRMLIVCNNQPDLLGESKNWSYVDLLTSMDHSLDNGKTWSVCGVEISK